MFLFILFPFHHYSFYLTRVTSFLDHVTKFGDGLFVLDLSLFYTTPFVLSSICYWRIIRALRARARMFALGTIHGFNPKASTRQTRGDPAQKPLKMNTCSTSLQMVQKRRNTNDVVAKMEIAKQEISTSVSNATTENKDRSRETTGTLKREPTHQHMSANRKVTLKCSTFFSCF